MVLRQSRVAQKTERVIYFRSRQKTDWKLENKLKRDVLENLKKYAEGHW